jgi:hypothetical protein
VHIRSPQLALQHDRSVRLKLEDDDHWDSVQINTKLTLGEMNAVIADPVVKLPDGSEVDFDVYAGSDLSNAGDMLCVSSCNGPFPCAICEYKDKN